MAKYDVASYNLIYIYAIHDEAHKGLLKIGQTSFSSKYSIAQLPPNCPTLNMNAHNRIQQQTKTALVSYDLLYTELATRTITMADGSKQVQTFQDHDVHDVILQSGYSAVKFVESGKQSEWYKIDLGSAKAAITAVKEGKSTLLNAKTPAILTAQSKIKLRDEQDDCVGRTIDMLKRYDSMLWNCKMRFGKTVTAYELIKRQGYPKVIVITHRPAVEDGWGTDHDLMFSGEKHLFIDKTNGTVDYDSAIDADNDYKLKQTVKSQTPFVYFASIQDLRGSKRVGGKYNKNNAVFDMDWDLLIVDEAHEGTSTDLGDAVIKTLRKPGTKVLLLSGTPYNIMSEFDENKYTWTYVDEQKAKAEWEENHPNERNPYEELPKMNIFTFDLSEQMPTSYRFVTEDSAFNFREFFRTWTGDIEKDYRIIPEGKSVGDFVYEDDVYNFLSLISSDSADSNYPFSTEEYRDMFAHTFWIVPGVKEAKALSALIQRHPNFKDFEVVNIAGDGDEEKPYNEALALVRSSIKSFPKTITISCGKLTTGVTVREWTAVMMLSGSSSTSASGYMQAIFRVQSPGYINGRQKKNCYVFDFAPDRTLKVIAEVHRVTIKGLKDDEKAKKALGEFINFCPIISVEGTVMRSYNVDEMMRQIKRISVDAAINSGFDDDTIYLSDAGMKISQFDQDILRKLADVVTPQKKGKKQTDVVISDSGMTEEQHKLADKAKRKPKKDLTEEEKAALELYKKQKEEQKKMFNLLRAVSIRLPLLFYGADADITEIIHLKDFVQIVDDESWGEFMPKGLRKDLFLDILRYYDEDVVIGAGLRIRKMAKAADELPPTYRAKRIVEIMSKFKNPDKETVLTPWRVVNMHMGNTLGGYNFYDEAFQKELDEPRVIDNGEVTTDVFLNSEAKVLEMNSKSGLYPLYLAYSFYMLNVSGKEKDLPLETTQKIWFDTLDKHIFVLCKTKMARMITIRTLAGYTNKTVHAVYLTKLVEERMKDLDRLSKKLTNPDTWNIGGDRMKFDAVVGNPPYQLELGKSYNQTQSNTTWIYQYFQFLADKVGKYTCLIYPFGSWFDSPDRLNGLGNAILHDGHTVSISAYEGTTDRRAWYRNDKEPNPIFGTSANLSAGISIIMRSEKTQEKFEYMNRVYSDKKMTIRFSEAYSITPNPLFMDINKKLTGKKFVNDIKKGVFGIESNFVELNPKKVSFSQEDWENPVLLLTNDKSGSSGRAKLFWTDKHNIPSGQDYFEYYKIVMSSAYPKKTITTGEPTIENVIKRMDELVDVLQPNSAFGKSRMALYMTKSQEECENFQKYIRTRFFAGLVLQEPNRRSTIGEIIPAQDYSHNSDIDWTGSIDEIDVQLYKKYGLSKEEICFIENSSVFAD